jgi:AcrR family transcriptional regulator
MTVARPGRRKAATQSAAAAPRTYNSPSMLARRQRILREVLNLIEEGGVENVTVRELAARSEVSPRTLYAAFGSKEELVARAVKQHFPEAMGENGSRTIPDSLPAVATRLDLLAQVVIRERKYSAAMARIYFSPTIDHRIYEVLKEIALSHLRPWVTILVAEKRLSLASPTQADLLLSQIANVEYAVINDWSNGRLTDAQLAPCLKLAAFGLIAGNLQENERPQLAGAIERLWRSLGSHRRP